MENTNIKNLWFVMPVYNEEEAVPGVIKEWCEKLKELKVDFTFCVLNDGSTDSTLEQLHKCKETYPNLYIVDKKNSGHGQTCIQGYRTAVEKGADWVFQIDSDGQCDPIYFPQILENMSTYKAVFGYRKKREDGFSRFLISRIVSIFVFGATGVWLTDANVPYRMMHRSVLEKALPNIPGDFYLSNILTSVLIRKQTKIKWVNIVFRDRMGGSPSIKTVSIMRHGSKLFRQLRRTVKAVEL